jgi:hypothetical protein
MGKVLKLSLYLTLLYATTGLYTYSYGRIVRKSTVGGNDLVVALAFSMTIGIGVSVECEALCPRARELIFSRGNGEAINLYFTASDTLRLRLCGRPCACLIQKPNLIALHMQVPPQSGQVLSIAQSWPAGHCKPAKPPQNEPVAGATEPVHMVSPTTASAQQRTAAVPASSVHWFSMPSAFALLPTTVTCSPGPQPMVPDDHTYCKS